MLAHRVTHCLWLTISENTFRSAVVGHGQSQVLVSGSNGKGVGNLFKDSRPYAVGSVQVYILLFIIANAYVVYGDDVSI